MRGGAGLPKSMGEPSEEKPCGNERVCAAGLGFLNPRGNPGEDNGCEEKPCGNERVCVCAAGLGSPNPR